MDTTVTDVAVFLPIDHFLTYVVPANLEEKVEVGKRVLVQVRNALEVGIVIAIRKCESIDRLKPVLSVLDDEPILPKELIDICIWISNYYISPPGLALQLAVPGFLRTVSAPKYEVNCKSKISFLPGTLTYQIISTLEKRTLSKKELKRKFRGVDIENELNNLLKEGILKETFLPELESSRKSQEKWIRLNPSKIIDGDQLLAWQRKSPDKARVYLYLLHEVKEISIKELVTNLKVSMRVVNALVKENVLEVFYKTSDTSHFGFQVLDSFVEKENIQLTEEQLSCLNEILLSVERGEYRTFLLYGITGSGKTEVYFRCIQDVISRGKQCIFLVPEISLTPQTLSRLIHRFGNRVAVIHSGITERQKYEEWHKIKNGKVDIVIGVRSALFAPFFNLGLIVVDEEHEHTYKQEETPRYHARDVAVMRAKLNSAVCILGSATPSLESFVNAERGKYTLLKLTKRVAFGSLPSVQVVDLRKEAKVDEEIVISELLKDKIRERLERREQTMLLINRRGFAPVVMCPSCGWVVPCPNCRTSLNYHRKGGIVVCHYCNFKKTRPDICEECGFRPLIFLGAGTQRIEDILTVYFPHATIVRVDTDTVNSQIKAYQILRDLSEGKIDILVGTQMIAKGHDYPKVTLVGVVNADVGLTLPNFRSPEYTFQLLMQVAGRTGRREYPGEVVIQTYMPNHYVIKAVQSHSYETFFDREIKFRSKVGYPPLSRMVHFGIESEDENIPPKIGYALVEKCKKDIENLEKVRVIILGPAPAIYRKLRGRYRWQFAILCKEISILVTFIKKILEYFDRVELSSKAKLVVDVDPYQIY
ncbi:MAG: primosomal protein N' [Candidatus Hydrogenedentes bacterium]|nr:primosomal protein N' [Candidatus Hydrogenedentota bacterium]